MKRKTFSAPTVINLEITDICNVKCRHCYNYWREDGNSNAINLTREKMDRLTDIFVEAGVFHVVLSGGEPFAKFDLLEYGFKKLLDNNISISCNSNLMLASDDKMKRLADIGLDHILTSVNSYDEKTNDFMVHQEGSFKKIVKGVGLAVKNGIRVSANMIVSQLNKDHVYQTGRFVHELGCQKIFGTRVVPSVNNPNPNQTDFNLTMEDALSTLEQLLRAKEETGIMIGTLVSYPLCLLRDLERFKDFVGRGCPAQSGHIMGINANGDTHACVHQEQGYGNIFEDGIFKCYSNMLEWHNESYHYPGCAGCDYLSICHTGCRMSALTYYGDIGGKDNLMLGKESFTRPYKIVYDTALYDKIDRGLKFTAPKRLRFRKESGFYLLNIRWANTITCPTEVAELLIGFRDSGQEFGLQEMGPHNRDLLAKLFFKDAIESKALHYDDLRSMAGLGTDIGS